MRTAGGMARNGAARFVTARLVTASGGLRNLRRDRGWTAEELAVAVGCDAETIVAIELGRVDVLPFAQGIADALGVSVADVVLGTGAARITLH